MTFDEWFDSKRGELRPPRMIDALRECWVTAQREAAKETLEKVQELHALLKSVR